MTNANEPTTAHPFVDFRRFNFGIFLALLLLCLGVPASLALFSGGLVLVGVLGSLTACAAVIALSWRFSRVSVSLALPGSNPPEIVVGRRRIPIVDRAAVCVGLHRSVSRGRRRLVHDCVRAIIPDVADPGAPLVLDELVLHRRPAGLQWLRQPVPRGARPLRSLSAFPGILAGILRDLGIGPTPAA